MTASTLLRPSATVWVLRTVVQGGTSLEKLCLWTGHWAWHWTPSNRKKDRWHKLCISQPHCRAAILFFYVSFSFFSLSHSNSWSYKTSFVTWTFEFQSNIQMCIARLWECWQIGCQWRTDAANSRWETGSSGGESQGQTEVSKSHRVHFALIPSRLLVGGDLRVYFLKTFGKKLNSKVDLSSCQTCLSSELQRYWAVLVSLCLTGGEIGPTVLH